MNSLKKCLSDFQIMGSSNPVDKSIILDFLGDRWVYCKEYMELMTTIGAPIIGRHFFFYPFHSKSSYSIEQIRDVINESWQEQEDDGLDEDYGSMWSLVRNAIYVASIQEVLELGIATGDEHGGSVILVDNSNAFSFNTKVGIFEFLTAYWIERRLEEFYPYNWAYSEEMRIREL